MYEKNCYWCLHAGKMKTEKPCFNCKTVNGVRTHFEPSDDYITCETCKHEDKDADVHPCSTCDKNDGMLNQWEDKDEAKNDPVNRPSHYTDGKIEVIEFIEDKKLGFCLGNAIKYIARAGKKNPDKTIEDINKAIWYLNRYIKELEEGLV